MLLLAALAAEAGAQQYPVKAVRILTGQAPGGATDFLARLFAQKLNDAWKQPVIVDSRPGAAGMIAAELTSKAPSDGYTLLLATAGQIVINRSLYRRPGYDALKDLAPVAFLTGLTLVLVTHPSVPVKSVKELIALGKRYPGRLTHGSGESGSPAHLAMELFKSKAGLNMVHVPYKGVGPSVVALISGEIDLSFASVAATLPHIKAGRLRALAVSTPKRSTAMPDLPTIAEAGVPGYQVTTWYGIFGPAALPRNVIGRVNSDVARVLDAQDVRARLLRTGAEPGNLTLEQFKAFIREDADRWAQAIRAAGIKPE